MALNITGSPLPPIPSLSNYTEEQIYAVYHVIWVCYPILLTLCTVGNVINLVVLAHEQNKGSTNAYMMAVSVADLFVMWLYLPIYFHNLSTKFRHNDTFKKAFRAVYGLEVWGIETSISLSDWTLIVFSLERLLAIAQPLRYSSIQTAKSARIATALLLCIAGMFCLYNAVEPYWRLAHHVTEPLPLWIRRWRKLQHQAEIIVTIFKFSALLFINGLVVCALHRQKQSNVAKMRAEQDISTKRRFRNSNLLLLGSAALYLVTQFPALVVNCLKLAAEDYNALLFPVSAQQFASPIADTTFMLNYSVNLFLYLIVSERYRAQFFEVIEKLRCTAASSAESPHDTGIELH